jgi:flagellar hook-basal body complex protein FliE
MDDTSTSGIAAIGNIVRVDGLELPAAPPAPRSAASAFGEALTEAIRNVDELQRDSEAAQASFARGEPVDLHDVLIRVAEADLAFRTLMEVRNKLVDAYREVMRMGSGA